MKVAIATCTEMPEADADEAPLRAAFKARSIEAEWLAWDDPSADFKSAALTVLRTTWNYARHHERFLQFIDGIAGKVENNASVLRWNTHKRYLRELDDAGMPTVDTILVPKNSGVSLQTLLKKKHWFCAVVKPAVGAGSWLTRCAVGSDEDEAFFAEQLRARDMLVQPYMAEVETSGERAVVYIDGLVTHAVRKTTRFSGDNESTTAVPVADDERALAERLMHWTMLNFPCGTLLYGRVDMIRDARGALRIMELELTEPSLFFKHCPEALSRFVAGIESRLAMARR